MDDGNDIDEGPSTHCQTVNRVNCGNPSSSKLIDLFVAPGRYLALLCGWIAGNGEESTYRVCKELRCLKDSPGMRVNRQLLSTSLLSCVSPLNEFLSIFVN